MLCFSCVWHWCHGNSKNGWRDMYLLLVSQCFSLSHISEQNS
jgi:hypothetical protein